jgi:hypothetical protein
MARVSIVQTATGPRCFYNITSAVGPGAPNLREDVLLVQYLLRENFKGLPSFRSEPFPGGVLIVDGIPGTQTYSAIKHYQRVQKKIGRPIATDGRVDAPVNEQMVGSISNTQYTIIYLNLGYLKSRPNDWPRLSQAGDCPAELRPFLSEPRFLE